MFFGCIKFLFPVAKFIFFLVSIVKGNYQISKEKNDVNKQIEN